MFISDYNQIKQYGLRTFTRKTALDLLSLKYRNSGQLEKYRDFPRLQFIYLHFVFNDEFENFKKIIQFLSNHFIFISYDEALNKISKQTIDKPYMCISFDDGFKNNHIIGKYLATIDVPAMFFICTNFIGLKKFNDIKRICNDKFHLPPVEFMDWNEIEKLQKLGHNIGSHTHSHINLGNVSKDQISFEIEKSREMLLKYTGKADHLSWPYGTFNDISKFSVDCVFNVGYNSLSSALRGCHANTEKVFIPYNQICIRRDHVIAAWPLSHIIYFLFKNLKNYPQAAINSFPKGFLS